ncbi:MAG: arginine--tRNA ligase, partial [Armatimonadetes bacterium]|nr:arginine--tRNA ligase [Armatimonadota bacterium]
MQDTLRTAVAEAFAAAVASGAVPPVELPDFVIETPPRADMGDFACNVAMVLARAAKMPPRAVAQAIIDHLPSGLPLERVEIAGPGFLNLFLSPTWLHDSLRRCLTLGADYGRSELGGGAKVQIEFVSANPVGPLHIGNARGGPFGDVLANLLEFTGHVVEREYYVNDARDNTQLQTFGRSLRLRYLELLGETVDFAEGLYSGEYVIDYARRLADERGDALRSLPDEAESWIAFADAVLPWVLASLEADLRAFGIAYDVWFSERSLHESGAVRAEIARLLEIGVAYEQDGAVWLKT